jgi:hypothetical protein
VKQTWDRLKPKEVDKTDIVSFLKRESLRDKLERQHPTRERRDEYLIRYAAEMSPELALAVIEAEDLPGTPAEARFVSEQTLKVLTRRLVAAENAEQIEAVEQIQAALEYCEPTILKAVTEIQASLAMNAVAFEAAVRDETRKGPPVWLSRRAGDRIVTIYRGEGVNDLTGKPYLRERPATEEELAVGVYYHSEDEWQAAVAAAA